MTEQELLIWAAGFFDGEGCISISCSKKGKPVAYYTLQLTAYQNVQAPLDIFVLLFGGRLLPRSEGGHIWQQTGSQTIATLSKLLPYLIVKRAQAEVAIVFQRRKVPKGGKYADPASARALDDIDFREVKRLKVIGG